MGKSTAPKYKLVVFDRGGSYTASWSGKATNKRLDEYIDKYIQSLQSGGCNFHISKSLGFIPVPYKAQITFNYHGGAVVAEWQAPMFMAI